jgi:hypoxanthine phosphoribosyltransferase
MWLRLPASVVPSSVLRLRTFAEKMRYIIVDDLVATGKTVEHILRRMAKDRPGSRCVGIFLYRDLPPRTKRYSYPPLLAEDGSVIHPSIPYLNRDYHAFY